jgi:RNA polymerase sigma-70 factor, ECF subfamily
MNAAAICQPGPGLALVQAGTPAPAPAAAAAQRCTATADAMSALWRLHGGALLRFAVKLTLGDRQRAEDIVQETLLRAWRNPAVVDGREHLIRPWLFTITRHVAIDLWRARSRHDEIIDDQPIDRPDPAERIDQTVTALDVRAAIAKLTPKHQQIIVEMYYHGRQVDEIARTLGIPEGTVKSRAYYALRHLKRLMAAPYADDVTIPQASPLPA